MAVPEIDELIDELLAGEEIDSELGQVRAYRRCVRYAERYLAADHRCNVFLLRAAERLGQPPLAIPVVHNRVSLPADAKLTFYYSDDEGPVLVGNASGLRYLGRLLSELAQAELPGENIILDEGYEPFVGDSYGLTAYLEDEAWFAAAEEGTEDEFVAEWEAEIQARIVTSEEIGAVQFSLHIPGGLALSPQKLYRVGAVAPWRANAEALRKPYRQDTDRVRILSLVDDENQPLELAVDLDDPDLTFYYPWHLEQFPPPDAATGAG